MDEIHLTQLVKKGGCAAKLPASYLRQVLEGMDFGTAAELLVGTTTMDDACVWQLPDGENALVQTLDFFTPIVDDPYDFGAIAAANALSDIYAMGAKPLFALSILAFPLESLSQEVCRALLRGAGDKMREAKAVIAGGHSIDDETLKLGFAVSGIVPKHRVWTNAGARPGDILILTKALGVGTITSAIKRRAVAADVARAAIASMKQLNDISAAAEQLQVHGATDITGFGLAGHCLQMALASGVSFEIAMSSVPVLPGASALLEGGVRNMAHRANREYALKGGVCFKDGLRETQQWLAADPQTSGGLLLAVPARELGQTLGLLHQQFPYAAAIGEVTPLVHEQPVLFRP